MSKRIYHSTLSFKECRERIEAHAYPSGNLLINSPQFGSIMAKPKGNRFSLHPVGFKSMLSSFTPLFSGAMSEQINGCNIIGEIRMNTSTRIFLDVWFGLAGLMTALFAIIAVLAGNQISLSAKLLIFCIPLPVVATGAGILWLARRDSIEHRIILQQFLQDTQKAEITEAPEHASIVGQKES